MDHVTRRSLFAFAGAAAVSAAAPALALPGKPTKPIKILGICGSARKGKTTATALGVALAAAQAVAPDQIEIELIELAGRKIDGTLAAPGVMPEPGQRDDFPALLPVMTDPRIAGILCGSPVYFGEMSSLLKAFFERCIPLRKNFTWSNKVGGALAVGGARNGGQENVLRSIHMCMFGQEMIVVGDGRPASHSGATLWNHFHDDILQDTTGIATAKALGRHVAEVARLIYRGSHAGSQQRGQ